MGARIELDVGGVRLRVLRLAGRSAVSELFTFRFEVSLARASGTASFVGEPFALTLRPTAGEPLHVRGIVTACERRALGDDSLVVLHAGPAVAVLAIGRDARVYEGRSVREIASELLAAASLPAATFRLAPPSERKRPLTVQRGEPGWHFLERLLREEGIHYCFEHRAATTELVFADDSTHAPPCGEQAFRAQTEFGVGADAGSVARLRRTARLAPDAVTMRDYTPTAPALTLEGKAKAGGAAREVYDWPARAQEPSVAKLRAETRLEALRAGTKIIAGESVSARLRAGHRFSIGGHAIASFNADYFCTEVSYTASEHDGPSTFASRFRAIPLRARYRPAWTSVQPAPRGPETAVVVGASGQEIDASARGEVAVKAPWDRSDVKRDLEARRARSGQAALGGSMALARVGWSVLVAHHDEDLERPWVVARLVDGAHPTPYALPAEMTRTAWQTATSPGDGSLSELRFEDEASAEEITLRAARDMTVDVGEAMALTIGRDARTHVVGKRDVRVGADAKVTVGEDQTVTVGGSETVVVAQSRGAVVRGADRTTVRGARALSVAGDTVTDTRGARQLSIHGAHESACGPFTREIVGASAATCAASMTLRADDGARMHVGGDARETIVGASMTQAKSGAREVARGNLTESVAGPFVISARGNVGETSKAKLQMTVGAAVAMTASAVEIEARSEIALVCGASTILIKPDSVEVKSPLVSCSGPTVAHGGATIKHNP